MRPSTAIAMTLSLTLTVGCGASNSGAPGGDNAGDEIICTGDDLAVFNGTCGAESGWVPVSAVAPAILFDRLEFDRVDDRAGSGTSLLEEIWRTFLALMMAALLMEAVLCIPKLASQAPTRPGAGFATPASNATSSDSNRAAATGVSA